MINKNKLKRTQSAHLSQNDKISQPKLSIDKHINNKSHKYTFSEYNPQAEQNHHKNKNKYDNYDDLQIHKQPIIKQLKRSSSSGSKIFDKSNKIKQSQLFTQTIKRLSLSHLNHKKSNFSLIKQNNNTNQNNNNHNNNNYTQKKWRTIHSARSQRKLNSINHNNNNKQQNLHIFNPIIINLQQKVLRIKQKHQQKYSSTNNIIQVTSLSDNMSKNTQIIIKQKQQIKNKINKIIKKWEEEHNNANQRYKQKILKKQDQLFNINVKNNINSNYINDININANNNKHKKIVSMLFVT